MVAPRGGAEACGWEPVMYSAITRPDQRVLCSVHLLLAVRTPAAGEALRRCCGVLSQSLNCKEILYVVGWITFL